MGQVTFHHVNKVFPNGMKALTDFHLNIAEGEFVVLVGPSGCGKSTVLRLLAGLEEITEGDILVNNQSLRHCTPQQRNIAMVFQNYALYPHMTVQRNLEFPLRMQKTSYQNIQQRVTAIAEQLQLTELLTRKPGQLSGGQCQRVAMGRALVRDPAVFLMDEPLSNLDAQLRTQIRTDIASLQKQMKTTTLYVTHDQVEAMTLGDRVVVLNKGEIQQVASPQKLYDQPANIFVAQFMGNPGINIFRTRLNIDAHGNCSVMLSDQRVLLSMIKSSGLGQYDNQDIYLGIRPESICQHDESSNCCIQVRVKSVEILGHETLVYFDLLDQTSDLKTKVARLPGNLLFNPTKPLSLFIKKTGVFLFDSKGEIIT